MLFRTTLRRTMAGSVALIALAATTATAADITVKSAKIAAGKLVITGTTTTPNTRVRLDGQSSADFNVRSNGDRTFRFSLAYHPGDCIVTLEKMTASGAPGASEDLVVADCGPSGISPRGAWSAAAPYGANDLVTHQGSSWLAKRRNVNRQPAEGSDWELFAAKGETGPEGPAGEAGPTGPAGVNGTAVGVAGTRVAPTGPAGGDLAGTYPNPTIRIGAVTTNKIGDSAVTNVKINNGSVSTPKIRNNAVTTEKIADGAVTSAKVLDDTLAGGGLAAVDLAANSVGQSEIATDGVAALEIADNSIDSGEIVDFSLTNQDIGVLFAQVNANGTLANSSGGVTTTKIGVGTYEVDFGRVISSCAFVMTQGEAAAGGAGGAITGVTDRSGNVEAVFATTRTNANALADRAFQLVVVC